MFSSKTIFSGIICLCCVQFLQAQSNKSNIKKQFTIRGQIGASSNFYNSNESFYTRPSFAWNVNGSFVPKINKVSLPFSFVVNQFNKSNASAHIQLGISPTYKWAKLHLGDRYIRFSPLTYGGQTFRGAGLELNPGQFRFAAFYGRLNKAFNEDTSGGRFRLPQYSRIGYGVKIGVGNSSRFLDVIYFHAKDDSSSASIVNNRTRNFIRAQENAVVGSSFKLTMVKKLILTGDMAISGLISDLSPGKKSLDSSDEGLKIFINNFLPKSASTVASYAGQSSLSYYSKKFNSSFSYRRIGPNFKSLGTPYLYNDVELITLNNSYYIAKGKLNISTNLSQQHNNLDKNLYTELRTQLGNINANVILSQHLNLNLNYSGYNLKQKNGNPQLPDSLRLNDTLLLNQRISQINISPSYNITKGNKLHYINGNLSLQNLKDKNPATALRSNSNNLSTSLNYTLSFIKQALSFSLNYLVSHYKQEAYSYKSNGVTFGTSSQLLKNKNMNIQGNIGYYFNKYSNTKTRNISYSANMGYHAKRHVFNLFANYIYTPSNKINDEINKIFQYVVATKNFYGGISYNYSIY